MVLWLDPQKHFARFAEELAARVDARRSSLVRFDGSWLEVAFALDPIVHTCVERPRLVLYLPGFDSESVRKTPALAVALTAQRFEPQLAKTVRDVAAGALSMAVVDAMIAEGPLELDRVERWFVSERDARWVERRKVFERVSLATLLDHLVALHHHPVGTIEGLAFDSAEDRAALGAYLHDRLGFDEEYCRAVSPRAPINSERDACDQCIDDLFTWLLSVEYVHDLVRQSAGARRPKLEPLRAIESLHPTLVEACLALCRHLREQHQERYPAIADHVEGLLHDELSEMDAAHLGAIDTFRIEDRRVLAASVEALAAARWSTALAMANARLDGDSIWLRREQLRRWEWQLVRSAAQFGLTLDHVGMPKSSSVERTGETLVDLVRWYEREGFEVDRKHRWFEQEKSASLDPRFQHFTALQQVVTDLRQRYRAWADAHARRWSECCEARGYLPPHEWRQRSLFDQVVQPLIEEKSTVVYFLVDALRFEMARDLADMLAREEGVALSLNARVAELPTITAVGMNCVVPVARGERLSVARALEGFRTGEFTVSRPADRAEAIQRRNPSKKVVLVELAEVLAKSRDELSKLSKNRFVVVQTRYIDDAGEANVGVRSFPAALQELLSAFRHMEAAGCTRFVFVSDHGFLLQDESTRVLAFGKKTDPRPRYVLDDLARVEENLVSVSPSALQYDGLEGKSLLFRKDTSVFATPNAGASFVHGGNSPQERIIPVLTVRTPAKSPRGKSSAAPQFELDAESMTDVLGVHRVRLCVRWSKDATVSLSPAPVAVGLRAKSEDPTATVSIRDVSRGTHSNGQVLVLPSKEQGEHGWTEVFFTLEATHASSAQIEVYLSDAVHEGHAKLIAAWFESVRSGPKRVSSSHSLPAQKAESAAVEKSARDAHTSDEGSARSPTAKPSSATTKRDDERPWLEGIPDANARKILARIDQYGMVTENEATELLGSARAMRRFALQLDEWTQQKLIPIRIRVDSASDGKRYTKEGDR